MLPYATIDNVKSIVIEMLKNYTPGPSPVGGGALVILGPFEVTLNGDEEWVFINEENTPNLDEVLELVAAGKKPSLHVHATTQGSGTMEADYLLDFIAHMIQTDDEEGVTGTGRTAKYFAFGYEGCSCSAVDQDDGQVVKWSIELFGS